ncbi:fumarylacetoacetate hydrolase family protein [Afifella pfennigii]|uniref:fumarylacetoacetate hydrolase family protein n=1 Tax=Afifella pfennigii TaxID=209897 RepID=UPI0004795330|nr:fumarylacetoacetate hydrolase family protein [Afifella pfennigii]
MKLITFEHDGSLGAGVLLGEALVVCETGEAARHAVRAIAEGDEARMQAWACRAADDGARLRLSDVRLLAPIPEPRRDIFCVGKNYRAHAAEFHKSGFDSGGREEVPAHPVIFTKSLTAVIGPHASINAALDPTDTTDYEGELAVVIGRRAFGVKKAEAMDYVFGYVVFNDVTARQLQRQHSQWVIGKGVDTYAPMGPALVTRDEVPDVAALTLTTRVNGQTRQSASLADLIFDIPTLIETMSATMTLLPGDIIATGTPAGVGIGFDPPRYLNNGDRVEVSITGLGTLANDVRR